MRRKILVACLSLLTATTYAQQNTPVKTTNPLKGSAEINRNPSSYYGVQDTTARPQTTARVNTPLGGNPNANRIENVETKCDGNSMLFSWTAIQLSNSDKYEIEQSSDGRNWQVIGVVPASRTNFGEATYTFRYNKNVQNAWYRIKVTNIGGEGSYSAILQAPCSSSTSVQVSPNPVSSTATVRITSPVNGKVDVAILDTKGAMVHSSDASLLQGPNNLPLDMSRLPKGYYSLVLRWSNGGQEVVRLVKH